MASVADVIAALIAAFCTGIAVGAFSLGLILHRAEMVYERENYQERA